MKENVNNILKIKNNNKWPTESNSNNSGSAHITLGGVMIVIFSTFSV